MSKKIGFTTTTFNHFRQAIQDAIVAELKKQGKDNLEFYQHQEFSGRNPFSHLHQVDGQYVNLAFKEWGRIRSHYGYEDGTVCKELEVIVEGYGYRRTERFARRFRPGQAINPSVITQIACQIVENLQREEQRKKAKVEQQTAKDATKQFLGTLGFDPTDYTHYIGRKYVTRDGTISVAEDGTMKFEIQTKDFEKARKLIESIRELNPVSKEEQEADAA